MRKPVLVLAVLLTTGAGLSAQTPPAPKAAPAADDPRLDGYLKKWEQKMREVKTLSAQLARIDKDKVLSTTTKYSGVAQYMKSGDGPTALNLAVLELKTESKGELAEKLICTGTYLYVFAPAQKEIRAYEMPRPKPGQVSDDGFLGLLFGMKADEAKQRYTLKMAKEDQWYVYVDIAPKDSKDKSDFARARLVLNKDSFLPRQLWFEHANGNEITWDIPRLDPKAVLDRRAFDRPQTPEGWKLVPVNRGDNKAAPVQPRVIRQSGPSDP